MSTKDKISIRGKVGQISRRLSSDAIIRKSWEQRTFKNNISHSNVTLDEKEADKFQNFIDLCRKSSAYSVYKKAFSGLCKLLNIGDTNVIYTITTKNKDGKKRIDVKHAPAKVLVTIPNGSILYHKSPAAGITELKPSFRDKNGIHLYSSQRIYFSIRKSTGRLETGNREKENHIYIIQEGIKKAYVDPLIPMFSLGCLYVERSTPIKVKEFTKKDLEEKRTEESVVDEEFESFATLQDFAEYYGLTVESPECFEESVAQKIGNIVDTVATAREIRKEWMKKQAFFSKTTLNRQFDEKDAEKLKSTLSDMTSKKISYNAYKKAFSEFCAICGISKEVCIENYSISNKNGQFSIKMRYSTGRETFIVPNGFELIHISPVGGLTELEPSFRSKTSGRYMYTRKRVFFTIEKKDINPAKAGLQDASTLYRYRPKEKIRCVYIDPSYPNYRIGAVYVETNLPIPVEDASK